MNPMVLAMITFTLATGTAIATFSSHWLLIWVGLEMNMLSIIPILTYKSNPRSTEAATKYFLTQATASMILMMAILLNLMYSGHWTILNPNNHIPPFLLTIALTMKLGVAPFHFWLPEVAQGVNLKSSLLLLTWQKIAPLSILHQIHNSLNTPLLTLMGLLSIMIGGWGGLNQTQLRKILAYSSIAHMGWMTTILVYNPDIMLLNLIIYITLTIPMFMLLIINSSTTALSLAQTWNKTPLMTAAMLTILMSLGGLPPLTGFMPKWAIINELTKNNSIILPTLMAMLALLNLYFYMRLVYSTSLTMFPTTNNMKMKWQFEFKNQAYLLSPLITVSTMSLPLLPLFISWY
ncbi:NADH dehydrogenase subunit 2 (mitochondrion) [Ochotona curzoniae]|uniref:NADH-ubiquinone oxidoreductase chain 2 n=1 Tax=Ochotona curzoniae TaxID=130825 RepID=B3SN59_OCHCU|nr:NADH dehydrogenase subunit 2 [Ochotona curzoniae]ABP99048.1 NADH dehydrogenase subunit 2 [Ochotona curzoniae]